eukprot:2994974-Amphidinium_carterae.1
MTYSSDDYDDDDIELPSGSAFEAYHCKFQLEDPLCLHHRTYLFADPMELKQHLHNAHGPNFTLDFVELCGGVARSTVLACRYSLRAGPNFDLVAGIDLNLPEHQAMTVAFVQAFRPLCVLMGPTCAPFGGWGRLNQLRSPEGWG